MIVDKLDYYAKVKQLNEATEFYDKGTPIMSDKQWDNIYFDVKEFEDRTDIVAKNSPTQGIYYEVVSQLRKVDHNHPMLSLDKTKDINVLKSFIGKHDIALMAKADGLTCSLWYKNGILYRAETRGNGVTGEDITHNAAVIASIPNRINADDDFVIDGELICLADDFAFVGEGYKNSRNFTSGSARLLDAKECAKRGLTFVAWDVIQGFDEFTTLSHKLDRLEDFFGFYTIPRIINPENLEDSIEEIREHCIRHGFPIDGVVVKYDNVEEYEACGRTDHHFKGGLAYKFYDETYSTKLRGIQWTMGRTGVLTPVARFDPIEIDGTTVEKASLHNVGIMRDLLGECAYVGEPLEIYKANQIIPQVASAGPKHTYGEVIAAGGVSAHDVITKCPICGHEVVYKDDFVYCDNPNCDGKLINRLDHFLGKKGLDIKGLSKKTLEKLVDWEWITCLEDIFTLKDHRDEWVKVSGFGVKSVDKILDAIEQGRHTDLYRVISAIGINNIGSTASIMLADYFKTWEAFRKAVDDKFDFTYLPNFGTIADYDLSNFDYSEIDNIVEKYLIINEIGTAAAPTEKILSGLVFVVTGKLHTYKNRDELKAEIESLGGKVTGSVSSKTNYLINNDTTSGSAKNQSAKRLGIPIINEDEFIALIQS